MTSKKEGRTGSEGGGGGKGKKIRSFFSSGRIVKIRDGVEVGCR